MLNPELINYCKTDRQREIIQAVLRAGSNNRASRELNLNRRAVDVAVNRVRDYAAAQGFAPEHDMTKPSPDGFHVKGTSTLYDADGNVSVQWVKTQQDARSRAIALAEACEARFEDIKPLPAIKAPRMGRSDLLAVYPLGDPHVGLYAWADEAGEDFDSDKARAQICAAVDRLVLVAPDSDTGVILNLGDFFHSDNVTNRTARAGNALDVDTRWARVLDIGIDTMIRVVRRALEKHKRVIVRNNIGNHDEHTSIMLSIALRAFFRNNKRVDIDTSPNPFWYYRHGKNLIGSTHGDRTKPADLPGIMASDRASDWGDTLYRYWYTGHIHHTSKHEFRGCTVESFRTLAASDAWHHGQGYRSGRDMRCIVLHRDFGEIEMHRVGVEQL